MREPLLDSLITDLFEHGLVFRGVTALTRKEQRDLSPTGFSARSLVLVGNTGSSLWEAFSQSAEYRDGKDDPLDRWSWRIGDSLAAKHGAVALFPFGGPPHHPFLQWAKRTEPVTGSMLGMMIHPDYGLWHAYRFALLFQQNFPSDVTEIPVNDICADCADKPCLNACPVSAFSPQGYDVDSCAQWLEKNSEGACMSWSCRARLACPVGSKNRYVQVHGQFHMKAFLSARLQE